MIEAKQWQSFIMMRWIELLFFFMALVGGSIYAVYSLQQGNVLREEVINYFAWQIDQVDLKVCAMIFLNYMKLVIVIWLCGFIPHLKWLNIIWIGAIVFSYGFTLVIIMTSLERERLIFLFLFILMQGTCFISYLLFFYRLSVSKEKVNLENAQPVVFIMGFLICILSTMLNVVYNISC